MINQRGVEIHSCVCVRYFKEIRLQKGRNKQEQKWSDEKLAWTGYTEQLFRCGKSTFLSLNLRSTFPTFRSAFWVYVCVCLFFFFFLLFIFLYAHNANWLKSSCKGLASTLRPVLLYCLHWDSSLLLIISCIFLHFISPIRCNLFLCRQELCLSLWWIYNLCFVRESWLIDVFALSCF